MSTSAPCSSCPPVYENNGYSSSVSRATFRSPGKTLKKWAKTYLALVSVICPEYLSRHK